MRKSYPQNTYQHFTERTGEHGLGTAETQLTGPYQPKVDSSDLLQAGLCHHTPPKLVPPGLQNVTVFGDRVFKEIIKMRPSGWVLTESDWCPCKKRKYRHMEKYQGCVHRGKTT